jgi:hypothetical protein
MSNEWTVPEFESLLVLPGDGGKRFALSDLMRRHLGIRRGTLVCAACGVAF